MIECGVRNRGKKSTFALMCEKVEQLECDKSNLEKQLEETSKDNALNTLDILRIRGII